MKICFVSSEFPPFSGGGIGTYTSITSRVLAEAGHEVHVIANAWVDDPDDEDLRVELIGVGGRLRVHRIAALDTQYRPCSPFSDPGHPLGAVCRERECSLFWSFLVAEKLGQICREFDIDVVEYPECFAEAYVALQRRGRVADPINVPTTLTLHSPMREIALFNELAWTSGWVARRGAIEDAAILLADTVSSPSRLLGEMVYARLGIDPADIPLATIPNSMDFDRVAESPIAVPRSSGQTPHLVFVGRIEPRKGVRELVAAGLRLLERFPDLTIELIGGDCEAGAVPGSMREHLEAQIPERLRRSFLFTDKLPRDELFARFREATACIFPPRWDNFPYTCCEAMAAGACVVVSSNSGMAEMVEHERSGLVFPAGSLHGLVGAVARILEQPMLAESLRAAAPERIRRVCDPRRIVPIKIEFYEKTIAEYEKRKKARRRMMERSAEDRQSVALVVEHRGRDAELRETVRSARIAARHANIELKIHVLGARRPGAVTEIVPEAAVEPPAAPGGPPVLRRCLDKLAEDPPTYVLHMNPGESLDEHFFATVLRVLRAEPDVAWATTWMLPVDGLVAEPFAGFDFSLPLEMMYFHPVPFAVISWRHYEEAGGWNTDLPDGWRQWDLWLAFERQGRRGVVVPVWQGRHHPSSARPEVIEHGKAYEMALEAITERNAELFEKHGATLWIADRVDRTCPPSEPDFAHRPDPVEPELDDRGREVKRQEHFDLLLHLADAVVDAPKENVGEAAFFSSHPLGGRTLMAHPPASIGYEVNIAQRSFLNLTLSMHPNTYDQPGGAVRFQVLFDGETALDETVDAKNNPEHRGWKDLSIDLARFSGQRFLELRTTCVPEHDGRFATAGWGRAHLSADPWAESADRARFTLKR